MKEYYTLITGSSSGLGKALALECARRGHNLLLVALPGKPLEQFSEKLKVELGVLSDCYAADLTKEGSAEAVYEWTRENNYAVNILINNAGMSFEGPFEQCSSEFYRKSIALNMVAMVSLTRFFILSLRELPEAHILNVSSVASYFPIPYKSVYSASKTFVLSFSRSLREELKNTGIRVSVVVPGPMVTNRKTAISAIEKGSIARMMHSRLSYVARYTIEKMERKKAVIKPGFLSKSVFLVGKVMPTCLKMKLSKLIFRR